MSKELNAYYIREMKKVLAKRTLRTDGLEFLFDHKNKITWWINAKTGKAGLYQRWRIK
jgi:hypothetical protein